MILVSSYIQTAFSMDDAMKLVPVIEEELAKEENIQLDFSDVKFFTTLFFNNAITRYVLSLGPQKYRDTFKLFNLSDVGMSTYEHSLDNALSFFELSDDKKQEAEKIISQTMQEDLG